MKIMSVLLILISPYLSLFVSLLGYYYQPLREKLWRFLLITFVFVSGFCINTTYELDIDRYYAILDICKQLSFFEVVNQLADGLILENFMFWFFSHLGVYELMPAFSAATVLGIGTYIAGDSAKRTNNLKFLWLIILFLLLITPIFNLASNVRNVLAFSLITLGTYRDLVQHKRGVMTLFLYIAPCFLHVTGVIISSLRLFIPIIRRFPLFCFCFLGIVSGLINVLHNYMIFINNFEGVIGTIVKRLLFKAFNYMEGASVYSQLMLNSVFDQINRPLTFFTAIIISYFSNHSFIHFPICKCLLLTI